MQLYSYIALILLLSFTRATARQTDSLPQIIHLHSAIVGDDYVIAVALPAGYNTSHASYPVLYVTDANTNFAAAARSVDRMMQKKQLPPIIVVGIGYRTDSLAHILRLRDMTPDHDPTLRRSHAGRSAIFLRFIKEELMPFVHKNYRASSDAVYAGMAIGGVFGLYVLFHQPETFHGYLIASPSIWYDSTVVFKYYREYTQTHQDLKAAVYLSAGSREETEAGFTHMETNVKQLAELLDSRHYPNLHIRTQVLEGETHFSVFPAALNPGLRYLFSGRR
ncbi:MAG TPA: alpha/beta hydrolase-fold protein [Puia sp.]|nr:alpha/beta hydrolase-fold protein [Puia sp.]